MMRQQGKGKPLIPPFYPLPASASMSQKGSILVSVVAFITLMAIAMGGFLGVARNMVAQESMGFNDDRAFLAAESGLLIGTRWLRESNNWLQYNTTGFTGNVYQDEINGYSVTVTVFIDINGQLRICSTTSGSDMPYAKSLSWTVSEANWGNPGVFINTLAGAGSVGGGGLNNEWFDGPVHTNTPIYIASVSGGNVSVRFVNGPVSTHNLLDVVPFDVGHWGNYGISPVSGNDYNFGIWMHDAHDGQYSKLDPVFEYNGQYTPFQHSQDSLYIPRITTQTRTLPQNLSPNKTAILYFDVLNGTTGQATYYYYDAAGNQVSTTFNNHNEIIRVPNDVRVLGTIKGQTTVITDLGYSICPVGDIMYHGFAPNVIHMDAYNNVENYGLGALTPVNNDVLALVSGADIIFGTDKYTLTIDNNIATLEAVPAKGNKNPAMYLTAQLIATEETHGVRWAETNVNRYNYTLSALGTRAIDTYEESHNAQGGPGNETFRFFYDTRFNNGLRAPGVPSVRADTPSGQLFVLNSDWSEKNIPQ